MVSEHHDAEEPSQVTHNVYLNKDACTFIRRLKPAMYTKEGRRRLGFYTGNVLDAEPENWRVFGKRDGLETSHQESPFDDQLSIVVPLTYYTQSLEDRVSNLETIVSALMDSDDEIGELVRELVEEMR